MPATLGVVGSATGRVEHQRGHRLLLEWWEAGVGVGTIGAALVRGLCSGPGGPELVVLSPRGAGRAAELAAEFPGTVRVASSNQAEEVLRALSFRPGQQVLSLVSTLGLARLGELASPAADCAVGMPLPAVAGRRGTTLLVPARPFAEALFAAVGSCVPVETEQEFKHMQVVTALMGDFYPARQLTVQHWLASRGVPESRAAEYVGALFATMASDSAALQPDTLERLIGEQTPGGINEMVWKQQDADGSYASLESSMEAVHRRLTAAMAAPAADRGAADGAVADAALRARGGARRRRAGGGSAPLGRPRRRCSAVLAPLLAACAGAAARGGRRGSCPAAPRGAAGVPPGPRRAATRAVLGYGLRQWPELWRGRPRAPAAGAHLVLGAAGLA
ncbi:unnamed protein product [Prorocentrum cordatum]|uniref:Pyrroline-5-carboxylate reductase catalytic N-terminal domain-containing protein n=1 Tax=Prorocentrum cordatum TaxID=2364126 RepID=A0ABN9VU86_9DINO|nr:unnamed protein product [Polarella glacialis]